MPEKVEYRAPRPTYSKFFWKDLIAKTQGMSAAGMGAYIRILGYMVTASPDFCSAPDDDLVLSRVTEMGLKAWRKVRPEVVSQLELTSDLRLRSKRLHQDGEVWAYHCYAQHLRRTGGQPAVDRRLTGDPPEGDHRALAREARSQKEEESDSVPVSSSGASLANPPPDGGPSPVAIAPGKARLSDEDWFQRRRRPATEEVTP